MNNNGMTKTSGKYKKFNTKTLVTFDIETVPDVEALKSLIGIKQNINDEEVYKLCDLYHFTNYKGNTFPRQLFHKIVCISYIISEIQFDESGKATTKVQHIKSAGDENSTEKEIIEGFLSYFRNKIIKKNHINLISFNGKTFDIPVLKYRALKHKINADWLMDDLNKFENYNYRYAADYHCDLMDILSDFGSSAKIKLSEICGLLNIPVKTDTSGNEVLELYQANKIQEIRNYCETDVIATYMVYLWHINMIGHGNIDKNIDNVISFLEKDKENIDHFKKFLINFQEMQK